MAARESGQLIGNSPASLGQHLEVHGLANLRRTDDAVDGDVEGHPSTALDQVPLGVLCLS